MLWVPVEKLFMNEIGFDAASVGVMAAAYAALVPLVEIPSGILADRWSRRGVLIVASTALMLTSLIGGLSNSVPLYIVSALVLAVYFAMYSGSLEAVVYDTLVEETGASDEFERRMGRVRFVESATLGRQLARRRGGRRVDDVPADVLPDRAVRPRLDRRAAAVRRAPAAQDRGVDVVAQPRRSDLPHDHPAPRPAPRDRADLAHRPHAAGDLRVRAAVVGRLGGGARSVRPVLGRPRVHARPGRPARRAGAVRPIRPP